MTLKHKRSHPKNKKTKKKIASRKTKNKSYKYINPNTIPRYISNKKSKKYNKELINLAYQKALETENVMLYFMYIFSVTNSKKKRLNILKKHRDKNIIIPKEYTNKQLEEFHLNLMERMPDIINLIQKEEKKNVSKKKKKDYLILFNDNDKLKLKHKKIIQTGKGPYMKRLTDKGEEPITGEDVERTLDEISEFLQSLRYTPIGKGATGFQVLYELLRGNEQPKDFYLKFNVMPKYATVFPPYISFKNILNDFDSIGDYLSLYTTHRRIVNQSKVDSGELRPEDLKPDFYDKLANQSQEIRGKLMQLQMARNPGMMLM